MSTVVEETSGLIGEDTLWCGHSCDRSTLVYGAITASSENHEGHLVTELTNKA